MADYLTYNFGHAHGFAKDVSPDGSDGKGDMTLQFLTANTGDLLWDAQSIESIPVIGSTMQVSRADFADDFSVSAVRGVHEKSLAAIADRRVEAAVYEQKDLLQREYESAGERTKQALADKLAEFEGLPRFDRGKESENWYAFYQTFNDASRENADGAYVNAKLHLASAEELHEANVDWFAEIMSHGIKADEIIKDMPAAEMYRAEGEAKYAEEQQRRRALEAKATARRLPDTSAIEANAQRQAGMELGN